MISDSDYDDSFCLPPKRPIPVDGVVILGSVTDSQLAELRALIKPLVLTMHKLNWSSVEITKHGTAVRMSVK